MSNDKSNIGGTSDLPNLDQGEAGKGVSPALAGALRDAVKDFEDSLSALRKKMGDSDAAREALLSGVELLNRVTTQVLGIVQAVRSGPAPEQNREWHQRRRTILVDGLGALVASQSGAERENAALTLVRNLLNR